MAVGIGISACSNSVNNMLTDYNGNFMTEQENQNREDDKNRIPKPGDPDFNQAMMLDEKYVVSDDSTLCLAAPPGAYYRWRIYRVDVQQTQVITSDGSIHFVTVKNNVELDIPRYVPCYTQCFSVYIPDVSTYIHRGNSYLIELTVRDSQGNYYFDTAGLAVYTVYYDDAGG